MTRSSHINLFILCLLPSFTITAGLKAQAIGRDAALLDSQCEGVHSAAQTPATSAIPTNRSLFDLTLLELSQFDGHPFDRRVIEKWQGQGKKSYGEIPIKDLELGLSQNMEPMLRMLLSLEGLYPEKIVLSNVSQVNWTQVWRSRKAGPGVLDSIFRDLQRVGLNIDRKWDDSIEIDWNRTSRLYPERMEVVTLAGDVQAINLAEALLTNGLGKQKFGDSIKRLDSVSARRVLKENHFELSRMTLAEICSFTDSEFQRRFTFGSANHTDYEIVLGELNLRFRTPNEIIDAGSPIEVPRPKNRSSSGLVSTDPEFYLQP